METTHRLRKPVESLRVLQQRKKTLAIGIFLAFGIAAALATLLIGCGDGSSTPVAPPPVPTVQPLQVADVQNIVQAAVNSVNVDMAVAVVDRAGFVLGVFRTQNAPATAAGNFGQSQNANDVAVALARTGAFFSNDQAPLSSRTVRFISGIHFPLGVSFVPNADLYGIENTNRGCALSNNFIPGQEVPRSGLINGTFPGLGIATGKADLNDIDQNAVNAGGVPLFRNGRVIGGIGVAGVLNDVKGNNVAEFAAFTAATTAVNGISALPSSPLPPPGAVVIAGIALPFVDQTTRPSGVGTGSFSASNYVVGPADSSGSSACTSRPC